MDRPRNFIVNNTAPLTIDPEIDAAASVCLPGWRTYKRLRRLSTGPVSFQQLRAITGHNGSHAALELHLRDIASLGLISFQQQQYSKGKYAMKIVVQDPDIDPLLETFSDRDDLNPLASLTRYFEAQFRRRTRAEHDTTTRDVTHLKAVLQNTGGLAAAQRYVDTYFDMAARMSWVRSIRDMYQHRREVSEELAQVIAEKTKRRASVKREQAKEKRRTEETPEERYERIMRYRADQKAERERIAAEDARRFGTAV